MGWAEAMVVDIRPLTSRDDDPEAFAQVVALYQDDIRVRDPGDPLPSAAEIAHEVFVLAPDQSGMVLVAEIDRSVVAVAWSKTESDPSADLQVAFVDVIVAESVRRQGVATALGRAIVPRLQATGQHSVIGFPCREIEPEAGAALCRSFGLTPRQEERCSRALVDDIDELLLAEWEADARTAAPGYRLEQWEGYCPDELAEAWSAAEAGMHDAPLDDIDHDMYVRDAVGQRAADEVRSANGYRIYRSLVLSAEGEPAGMSAIYVHEDRPEVGYQDDTAVLAAHRGHRIGRWLKAANYRMVKEAHPELAVLETYNAQSNPWMLDINIAMGFRPHHYYNAHQGTLDDAARR